MIKLQTKVDGRHTLVLLNNVLHVPSARVNLISGSELDKKGVATWICKGEISLLKSNSVISRGALWNDLYKLDLIPLAPATIPLALATTLLLDRIEPQPLIDRIQTGEEMAAALKSFNSDVNRLWAPSFKSCHRFSKKEPLLVNTA